MPKSFAAAEVEAAAGAAPVAWQEVASGGWGRLNAHWRVELADGRRVFVKHALDDRARGWLRDELRVYRNVDAAFLPRLLGWHDDGETLLVLEDLRDAEWPPPWLPASIDAVLATLADLRATPPPPGAPRLVTKEVAGWHVVARDPQPFLATGVCGAAWLERALPELVAADERAPLDGESLVHLDVRSDNLCIRDGRAVLFDWNWAMVGNGDVDLAFWLPSLRLEGGPEPWEVFPGAGALAAVVAGFFAARAGLPPEAGAPTVREFQRAQAEVALPWAARELGLPPPE